MPSKNKKTVVLFFIIAVILIIFAPFFLKPLQRPLSATVRLFFYPFLKATDFFMTVFSPGPNLKPRGILVKENDALSARLEELATRLNNYEALLKENERLSGLLNLKENYLGRWPAVLARVAGFSAGNWYSTMVLDKGARDGIKPGDPVINEDGVIGRIIEVNDLSSLVLLITDPDSSVTVEVLRNSLPAVVSGQLGQPLLLNYVVNSADIKEGDEVVTSGKSGFFPPGFKVGRVIKIIKNEKELFARVQVATAADFSKLNKVFVILR